MTEPRQFVGRPELEQSGFISYNPEQLRAAVQEAYERGRTDGERNTRAAVAATIRADNLAAVDLPWPVGPNEAYDRCARIAAGEQP